VTFVVFVAAMLGRLSAWKKLPQPGMTLFPTSPKGTTAGVLKETLLFPSLFRSDRFLWATSWLFHAMLALIVLGHLRVVTDFPWLWNALHIDADSMSAVVGGAAGVMILAMLVLLIGRRIATPRVREISAPGDYFAVFLLLAIVLTGNAMRFLGHVDLAETRQYFVSRAAAAEGARGRLVSGPLLLSPGADLHAVQQDPALRRGLLRKPRSES
jgi:nitrate reductase gamma subunit